VLGGLRKQLGEFNSPPAIQTLSEVDYEHIVSCTLHPSDVAPSKLTNVGLNWLLIHHVTRKTAKTHYIQTNSRY